MAEPTVIIGYVGPRDQAATIHAVNPPPVGQPEQPMCGTVVGTDFRIRTGTPTEVSCRKCQGTKTGIVGA